MNVNFGDLFKGISNLGALKNDNQNVEKKEKNEEALIKAQRPTEQKQKLSLNTLDDAFPSSKRLEFTAQNAALEAKEISEEEPEEPEEQEIECTPEIEESDVKVNVFVGIPGWTETRETPEGPVTIDHPELPSRNITNEE